MFRGLGLLLLAFCLLGTTVEADAQVFPRPGQRNPQNPGLPDAEQRKQELILQHKIASSRMGIKTCVDRLAISMKDDLMTEVSNQVRARFYSDAWERLTQYYIRAGLAALYDLEERLTAVAASAESSCFFYKRSETDKQTNGPVIPDTNSPFPGTGTNTGNPLFDQMR